ncbi:hypothetical protein P8452_07379 [Trifolium repens]|nr:hypothetical protein P8452_07379 [Trifolium repens]
MGCRILAVTAGIEVAYSYGWAQLLCSSCQDLGFNSENVRIKVRVIHLWKVPAFLKPSEYISLEFVLVDEKGGKIHASIRKQLVNVFESKVEEGEVYESKIVALIHSSKPHILFNCFCWCIGYVISYHGLSIINMVPALLNTPTQPQYSNTLFSPRSHSLLPISLLSFQDAIVVRSNDGS